MLLLWNFYWEINCVWRSNPSYPVVFSTAQFFRDWTMLWCHQTARLVWCSWPGSSWCSKTPTRGCLQKWRIMKTHSNTWVHRLYIYIYGLYTYIYVWQIMTNHAPWNGCWMPVLPCLTWLLAPVLYWISGWSQSLVLKTSVLILAGTMVPASNKLCYNHYWNPNIL